MLLRLSLLLLLVCGSLAAQNKAICTDPVSDPAHPPAMIEMSVPSHGEKLYGIFYTAAGAGNHPTVVLLHGFPGYEQNLDLAQAIRRAGWNVLAVHYRGSWGVGGTFSLQHAMEDADAMVAFVRLPDEAEKYHIDRNRIVIVGHSMGAYIAASALAHEPGVVGAVMIGTGDLEESVREKNGLSQQALIAVVEKANEVEPQDFLPLRGYDAHSYAVEIATHQQDWNLLVHVNGIGKRPVLLLTADDGSDPESVRLEKALHTAGNENVQRIYTATDHPFSDRRIYLATLVVDWL